MNGIPLKTENINPVWCLVDHTKTFGGSVNVAENGKRKYTPEETQAVALNVRNTNVKSGTLNRKENKSPPRRRLGSVSGCFDGHSQYQVVSFIWIWGGFAIFRDDTVQAEAKSRGNVAELNPYKTNHRNSWIRGEPVVFLDWTNATKYYFLVRSGAVSNISLNTRVL